jgi:hypothetical protein
VPYKDLTVRGMTSSGQYGLCSSLSYELLSNIEIGIVLPQLRKLFVCLFVCVPFQDTGDNVWSLVICAFTGN